MVDSRKPAMKRKVGRPRKLASIEADGDGFYWIIDKRHRQATGTRDHAEAERKLGGYLAEKTNPCGDPRKVLLGELISSVALVDEKGSRRVAGELRIRPPVKARLLKFFGDVTLENLSEKKIKMYALARLLETSPLNHKHGGVPSGNSIRSEIGMLSVIVGDYCRAKLIKAPSLWRPPIGRTDEFLSVEEVQSLIAAAEGLVRDPDSGRLVVDEAARARYRPMARLIPFAAYTGSRVGTVLAATWSSHTDASHLDIKKKIFVRRGRDELESGKARPSVALADDLLKRARRWQRDDARLRRRKASDE